MHGCWRSQSQSVWDKGQVSAGEEDAGGNGWCWMIWVFDGQREAVCSNMQSARKWWTQPWKRRCVE